MSTHHDHRGIYKLIWMALLFLTVITVWVASFDFGILNIFVAMFIATIKATLVALYFMHLKEDNRLNQVVFASAFIFLFIFVALTASDELVRPSPAKAKVVALEAPAGNLAVQHKKFRTSTPELLEQGKQVYAMQCATCHGAEGKGNGPAAGALSPGPRDFTSGQWTQGGTPSEIFQTVTEGVSGTGMSSFGSLPVKDRWAVVHYIRSLSPNTPDDTEKTLAKSGIMGDGKPSSPKIPVEMAIDLMLKEASHGDRSR